MADICYFEMKAVGEPVNLWEFIDLLQRKGAYKKTGIRWISFDEEPRVSSEKDEEAYLRGTCRWSVHSTMLCPWAKEFHTLLSATKELNLTVEVYGEGSCFQEHYIVDKGVIVLEDDVDYEEYCIADMSADEFCDCIQENRLTGKQFLKHLEEETLKLGSYENWDFQIGGI